MKHVVPLPTVDLKKGRLITKHKRWPERIGVIAGCITIVICAPYWFVKGMFK